MTDEAELIRVRLNHITPLTPAAWDDFRAMFAPVTLSKGEYLARQGEVATTIGILLEGIVRAFFANRDGTEYSKTFFTPPAFVGAYASLVSGQPTQICLQALTSCRLWVAEYEKLTILYDRHPSLERLARRQSEWYFVDKEQREIELVMLDAEQRYELFRQRHPDLEQRIPQYYIASYLGITPTQLSRIRAKRR